MIIIISQLSSGWVVEENWFHCLSLKVKWRIISDLFVFPLTHGKRYNSNVYRRIAGLSSSDFQLPLCLDICKRMENFPHTGECVAGMDIKTLSWDWMHFNGPNIISRKIQSESRMGRRETVVLKTWKIISQWLFTFKGTQTYNTGEAISWWIYKGGCIVLNRKGKTFVINWFLLVKYPGVSYRIVTQVC